ncbi:zinc finger protein 235-like isoform X3 [Diabrotica virgifera virgifera]|uniref:C2H2-type domain-containing protein n=1 Tax=Diabrotica virgifera virgifera TaxID=50390 RepID=A0ABM5KYT2_DIAVI|nr:zinc finger protein 235-like isoform X3 [Diabrotica virgifera virgifera]
MEVKQEITEERYAVEHKDLDDALLDGFKCEIKDEWNNQSTHEAYDYLDLKEPEIKLNQMEIKQEIGDEKYKALEDYNEIELNDFKCEIKEESNSQIANDPYDYLDLKEYPIITEELEHGNKLNTFEENKKTEKDYLQDNKMEILEALPEHSSHEGNYMNPQFIQGSNLIVHTEEKRYKCEICWKQFTSSSYLKVHMRVHTGEKPYVCEICLKQFAAARNLKQHLTVHTSEKRYKCEICFKQFSQLNHLKRHLIVHTEEKPHKCEICLKQFAAARYLKQHLSVHTGEKPYKCEICFKQFSTTTNLKTHLIVHTKEKAYKCDICFRQFSTAGNLKRHLGVHTKEKPYKCKICCKEFNAADYLNIHLRLHT